VLHSGPIPRGRQVRDYDSSEGGSVKAEIVAVGTELLLGQIVDTNSAHIARQLTTVGLDVHFKSTVGDNLDRIKVTLQTALSRSNIVITTGGIGPTLDDLTRDAIAEVTGRPLTFQPHLYQQIEHFFTRLGRPVGENNRRQAYIPEGAIPIENPVGTAPGFIVEQGGRSILCVPGVPHEMRHFMEHSVMPYLRSRLGISEVIVSRVLKLFGIGESLVDERLHDLIVQGQNPTIGLLAHTQIGEVHVRLTAKAESEEAARALNAVLESLVRARLQEFIFGADEETYEGILDRLLLGSGLRVAVAETGGGTSVIQTLKGMGGGPTFFALGVTVCEPASAAKLLPGFALSGPDLVNAAGARALAEGVRGLSGADLGIGVTGRVGQDKSHDHVVYIALASSRGTDLLEQKWPFALRYTENRMTKTALAQIRKYLLDGR
jgi:nicotinamide-nucleotide amidase